jgi:hypothetical protein
MVAGAIHQMVITMLAPDGPCYPRLALQTPAQVPAGPWPRQVPLPELRVSRPDPTAYCGPLDTRTVTWPDELTPPEGLTGKPPA